MALSNDWGDVNNPVEQPVEFWAKVTSVEKKWYVFQGKGQPRIPFDPSIHSEDDARAFVAFEFESLKGKVWVNEILVQSKDWANHTWKSAKELGILDVREMVGKYFLITDVQNGQYKAKVFKAMANTREEIPSNKETSTPIAPAPVAPKNDMRAVAIQFLPVVVKQSGGDKNKLATLIASNPILSQFFTIESQEVKDLLQQQTVLI